MIQDQIRRWPSRGSVGGVKVDPTAARRSHPQTSKPTGLLIQIMARWSGAADRGAGLEREDSMDVLEAIRGRRAVRDYTDTAPSEAVIRSLIDTATWAPSGVNLQPWCFFLADDRATLATFSAEAKALMLGQADEHPEMARMRPMLASPEFNIFYNAPVLVVICATTSDEMALKDCCLAAQALMLAAYAQGLGTCWIGFSEAWLNTPAGRVRLGIPTGCRAVAPIIIGYPKGPAAAPERRAPDVRHVAAGKS